MIQKINESIVADLFISTDWCNDSYPLCGVINEVQSCKIFMNEVGKAAVELII